MKASFFFLIVVLTIISCKPTEVTVNVEINQRPVSDIQVIIPKSEDVIDTTDLKGRSTFFLKRKLLGVEDEITVKNKDLEIDTTYILPLRSNMSISIIDEGIPRLRTEQMGVLKRRMKYANDLLDSLEKDVKAYLMKYPQSTVRDYIGVINVRRDELIPLAHRLDSLYAKYESVLGKLRSGDVTDFMEEEILFSELSEHFRYYLELTNETKEIARTVIGNVPDSDFKTDIFFKEGEFRIGTLSNNQKKQLQSFKNKIDHILEHINPPNREKVIFNLETHGYTDGQSCEDDTINSLSGFCPNINASNCNVCLSKLRATEIRKELVEKIPSECQVKGQSIGYGSKLATDESDQSSLRKCAISFSVLTEDIKKYHKEFEERSF